MMLMAYIRNFTAAHKQRRIVELSIAVFIWFQPRQVKHHSRQSQIAQAKQEYPPRGVRWQDPLPQ